MTDRYAVIGNPVSHSKSPWIHAAFARATQQQIEYTRIEAPLAGFAATVGAFRAEGGRGANVTLPFKSEAFALCGERLSSRARAAQAVNTLVFEGDEVRGDNTDGVGLVNDLRNLKRPVAGRDVLLMGAGGAAQGVLSLLLAEKPNSLVIANRTAGKARALAERFGAEGVGYDGLQGRQFDLVINATSAGLGGEASAVSGDVFRPAALAYDMVYGRDTPFLAMARAAGVATSDGSGMLVEQAAESFFLWRGVRPDTAPVLAALRNP
jgi:shikimate dehydrogenase